MYPDWPQSPADLVPLPNCQGPVLQSFDFKGPQKIKFLDHLGEGDHAQVFKVEIREHVYALKVFRFGYDDDWLGPAPYTSPLDRKAMSAFYNYSEPFSAECRAFGRLQETGHEDLAVQCFGYILLDEEHEQVMMSQFSHLNLELDESAPHLGLTGMRSRFLGRDGRPPPLRGIVKALGKGNEPLKTRYAKRLHRNVVQLQQLGIILIDVAHRQLIDGKFADFSTAITTPHFVTTPELNPHLTPEWISAMEYETFQISINDHWSFDNMVVEWNHDRENRKNQISVFAFPGGHGCRIRHNLRPNRSRERVYTFVDPRLYNWRAADTDLGTGATRATIGTRPEPEAYPDCRGGAKGAKGAKSRTSRKKAGSSRKTKRATSTTHRALEVKPPRWYYDGDSKKIAELKSSIMMSYSLDWVFQDGFLFPRERTWPSF